MSAFSPPPTSPPQPSPPPPPPPPPTTTSRYTHRHLTQLSNYSAESPLRVIAHIDLDAFYAQCEMKRLGVAPEVPLAVSQWANLIAVNYPARAAGVTRHITAVEARKLCPTVQLVHVAVWRAGETTWSYIPEPSMAHSKACLDPYRAASKEILAVFRDAVGADVLLEKASIDESFLDLSKLVHRRILARYPELAQDREPGELLPLPQGVEKLDWAESHLVANVDGDVGGDTAVDWDDVAMAEGAHIVADVRRLVWERLGYTCSAGISNNKMLAKLGSGYRKPNQQSVVRLSAVQPFLNTFEFTKIRGLGGKLGTQISTHFNTTSLTELLAIPLPQLSALLSDDTATWVFNVIRGHDKTPVTPRTALKSMLSAKSFRDPYLPASASAAHKWLMVFISDISSRLADLDADTRPRHMSLNYANASGARSRQAPLGRVDAESLLATAAALLRAVASEERDWPCVRLSVEVAGFEVREAGNRGIAAFLVKGAEAREVNSRRTEDERRPGEDGPPVEKKRRTEGIGRFFVQTPGVDSGRREEDGETTETEMVGVETEREEMAPDDALVYTCPDCAVQLPVDMQAEHADWHFAKALAMQDALPPAPPPPSSSTPARGGSRGRGRGGGAGGKRGAVEKGQKRLAF
ncbi:hypothetical protein EDC01DRAFT_746493 [Geopyxis carbonaria]|nr:hypothetical protein EDC01DRAFT_746493 [Geopyxis carbonaria]